MTERNDLEAALQASAEMPTPAPDDAFVAGLEARLAADSTGGTVVPFARRARRVSAGVVVAATLTFAGAAAAAGIAVTHPFRDDPPASTAPSSTSVAPSTSAVVDTTTGVVDTTVPSGTTAVVPSTAPPATTSPVTVPITAPPTVAPTAPPATTTPPTAAPTTAAATTSTEMRTPATLSLACAVDAGTVRCNWSAGPAGTVRYAVLRSQPSTGPGRVYFVDLGTTTWTDPLATSGTTATYLVHAFDANDHSLGHSAPVSVPCC